MELMNNFDELLLELSVAIGSKPELDLAGHILPLFSDKLDCGRAVVIKCAVGKVLIKAASGIGSEEQTYLTENANILFNKLSANQPFEAIGPDHLYVFLLPEYGLLALGFPKELSMLFVQKFIAVIGQLAVACIVNDKMQALMEQSKSCNHECELLNAVIQSIPDPLYVKDTEGKKILANKAEADLLGANDVSEVLGKKDADFYPEEIASITEAEDKSIIETGNSVIHRDGILITRKGKEIWLQGTKIPHYDADGNVTGIIGISYNVSEYKRIENELRIVAEKFQSIFNSFLDLYYRSDLNGTILEVSPSVYELSGYRPVELIGKSVSTVYADVESRDKMIKLLVEKGSVNDYENLFLHKDGRLVPVSITSHLIKDSGGKPGYIEGTIRDITERKEADEKMAKLLKLQNLLTHLATGFINIPVENSNEAVDVLLSIIGKGIGIDRVYIFDYDFANDTMSNTHEWCADGIKSEIANLQVIPNKLFPNWVNSHRNGEMFVVDDVSKLDKNNALYQILVPQDIKTLMTIPLILNNECIGFVGFDSVKEIRIWNTNEMSFLQMLADLLCNVADRKRAEEVLRTREASLKAIFNNVPFQLWLKDVEGKYLAVNHPFIEYFGFKDESEIIGKTATALWTKSEAEHFIHQDNEVMAELELRSTEELLSVHDKSVWFEIFRAPIVDQNGNLLGTTGIARDITDRKNSDKALQQAVQAAQAANEAKSRFLAIMSHEIRNPLNAVVGMVRMLHDEGVSGPNQKLVENIKTSSDQLLMIINDILDFSKIESGEMLLEEANMNIHEVVKKVYDSNAFVTNDKQIELKYSVDDRIGTLHKGDPLRLQQVLSNLVSNAIKFTSEGKIEMRCVLEKETSKLIRVRFEVEDTGIGISEENLDKIFESYKQENSAISRTHGGSGLGLAICKQIVELMGGKLSVDSAKNVGSKFYFTIELQRVEDQATKIENQDQSIKIDSLSGYSVLLVEDNKLNQVLATTMLQNWGAKVKVAINGQIAVEIVEKEAFDIILMDIQMPVMDGLTASKLIREKLNVTTPILALSANVLKGVAEKCTEVGMQGYISKPYEAEDLYKKIVSFVNKDKAQAIETNDQELVVADITRLKKMIGNDPSELNMMIGKFLEITPAYTSELNRCGEVNNLEAIASASHKIKSSIDLVATSEMRDLIVKINQLSRSGGDLEEIKELIVKFNSYYKLLETQLAKLMSK